MDPALALSVARLKDVINVLEQGLLERGEAVRLALLAALAGEHVLLIGPPGTAKSELARRLHRAFDDAPYFERLLTRFSTPEELFGPLSLKALEDDRYERLVAGYLPTAGIAFLDEVFKANSAILNALLTLLNEREFDNGCTRSGTPLICVVGASNEIPADDALMAFYDRFLVRVPVQGVSDAAFEALLRLPVSAAPAVAQPLRREELARLQRHACKITLSDEVLASLHALRARLAELTIEVSDRRWRQLVGLLQTAAAAEGRNTIDIWDLWLVPYVTATEPSRVPELRAWFIEHVAHAAPLDLPWLARAVDAFEQQLEIERSLPADDGDATAGKLALAQAAGGAADGNMLRIVASALEDHLRRRFSLVHVAARVAQIDELLERVRAAIVELESMLAATRAALSERLWMPPALTRQLLDGPQRTLDRLLALRARLDATRAGFAALPLDANLTGANEMPPAPVALSA